jgi:hypothetical protein
LTHHCRWYYFQQYSCYKFSCDAVVATGYRRHHMIKIGGLMSRPRSYLALAVALVTAGCASQTQLLDENQTMAVQTAVRRGEFEMNCPQVNPVIISREVIQPALQGPNVVGILRAEYTIGLTGCGKRHTYVVICPQFGDGCFAAGPGRFYNEQ